MKRVIKRILFCLNVIRAIPVYLCYLCSKQKELIYKDMMRWKTITSDRVIPENSDLFLLTRLLATQISFRNIILMRLKTPPHTIKSFSHYIVTKLLWKPLSSLYINTYNIGGGFFIQHGFSTIIDAESIGENCWINQQVTIGYSGQYHPTIGDNCTIHAGAKVIGKVVMHNNSTVGANAVVVKDVPENVIVGGIPARVIKIKKMGD